MTLSRVIGAEDVDEALALAARERIRLEVTERAQSLLTVVNLGAAVAFAVLAVLCASHIAPDRPQVGDASGHSSAEFFLFCAASICTSIWFSTRSVRANALLLQCRINLRDLDLASRRMRDAVVRQ